MRGLDALKLKFCQRIEAITAVEKGKYFVCTGLPRLPRFRLRSLQTKSKFGHDSIVSRCKGGSMPCCSFGMQNIRKKNHRVQLILLSKHLILFQNNDTDIVKNCV